MVFDLFHESIQDNLDLFGHLAMEAEGEEQLKYYKHFQQFHDLLPEDGQIEYGRVYIRLCMLREAVDLTVGLLLMDPDTEKQHLSEFEVKPLNEWSRNDWKRCTKGLSELLDTILEKGAVVGINEANDETVCQERAKSKKYNIEKITRSLEVCGVLAPLRAALKDQLHDKRKKGTPKVSRTIITNFHKEIEKLQDPNLLHVLRALVIEDESTGDLKMKDMQEVRSVLMERAELSVERAATKTLEKLKSWSADLFEKPRLYTLHFDESDDEAEEEEEEEDEKALVETLASARENLMENVDDPLKETLAAAAEASTPKSRRAKKPSTSRSTRSNTRAAKKGASEADEDDEEEDELSPKKSAAIKASPKSSTKKRKRQKSDGHLSKKKAATQMKFDDDDEILPDPEETLLSDLPERAGAARSPSKTPRKRKSQQKSYDGRRVWTEAETTAVKEGIRQGHLGKWAQIKDMFEVVLQHRTSGQIKDKYRVMLKRGELADVLGNQG